MKQLLEVSQLFDDVGSHLEGICTALADLGDLAEEFAVLFCVLYLGDRLDLLNDVLFFVIAQIGLDYLG